MRPQMPPHIDLMIVSKTVMIHQSEHIISVILLMKNSLFGKLFNSFLPKKACIFIVDELQKIRMKKY